MTTDQHLCELRVLLGPQAGSRLPLSTGEYLLGTSEACTIILAGPRVASRHLTMRVDEHGIRVRSEEAEVHDAAGAVVPPDAAIANGSPLEMGGIWITVDSPQQPWPDADTLTALATPRARTPEPAPASAQEPDAAGSGETSGQGTAQPETPQAREGSSADDEAQPARRPAHAALLGALAAGACACMAFGMYALWPDAMAATPPAAAVANAAPAAPARSVDDVLKELQLAQQLSVAQRGDGTQRVSGYVANGELRSAVMRALADLDAPPQTEIYAEDQLAAAASELLSKQRLSPAAALQVQATSGGTLRLAGSARDTRLVDAAANAVLSGVPGVHTVDAAGVLLPDALVVELKQRLAEARLDERIAVSFDNPTATLSGVLDEAELGRWQKLQAAFRVQHAEALPLRLAFGRPAPRLPFEIKTIVSGPAPYIVTADGEHVARGGQIGGLRLATVDDTQVVFDGRQQRLQLPR